MSHSFTIDPEFHQLIPPLSDDEFEQLEANVIAEGCRDALVVWQEQGLLLDGHNRYNICSANEIGFDTVGVSLPDRQAAINWIIDNQLGRRNLTPQQASYLRGKRYNAEKADRGAPEGNQNAAKQIRQNDGFNSTAQRIASLTGVSPRTVERDGKFAESVDAFDPDTKRDILSGKGGHTKQEVIEAGGDAEKLKRPHVTHNSGNNEWYTPNTYIEAARNVLGSIDLDPASSPTANEVVQAHKIYTIDDDGLAQEWRGRVWMNPPYSGDLVGKFAEKIVNHYASGDIEEAIVLVNNATETQWFHAMAEQAECFCFPKGRVRFWSPDGEMGAPLQGQAILYFGWNQDRFADSFKDFGIVARKVA